MNADDVHAKLVRSLERADGQSDPGTAINALEHLTKPLALASIALELRELRLRGAPMTLEPVAVHESTDPATERSAKVQADALDDDAF